MMRKEDHDTNQQRVVDNISLPEQASQTPQTPPSEQEQQVNIDVRESRLPANILDELLRDKTKEMQQNKGKQKADNKPYIIWATDDYAHLGEGYAFHDPITPTKITGEHEGLIKPRSRKDLSIQSARSKDKAEVFTPSWLCNLQNNLADEQWFGPHWQPNIFNNRKKIRFSTTEGKTWRDYVKLIRMEITCGEAPYLTSRYDTVTGRYIKPFDRIGILDRKFRVVHENTHSYSEWHKWMLIALQSVYGYEWQGDNLLLARENILMTYIDFYQQRFRQRIPTPKSLHEVIEIITWNIWQMDGIRCTPPDIAPYKKHFANKENTSQTDIQFPDDTTYCRIMDWDVANEGKEPIPRLFNDLFKSF